MLEKEVNCRFQKTEKTIVPRSTKLNLLQPVHNLMKVENKLCTVGNEKPSGAVQS